MDSLRERFIDFCNYQKQHWYFTITIFLSAFLLFQVQPMIGKYILPWFGGTPAVWTTCMLFFQVLLLGGYAYAHWLNGLNPKTQGKLQSTLLIITFILMVFLFFVWQTPITPDASWKPTNFTFPIFYVLRVLLISVGLPYFLLATTSSLIQAWFSKIYHTKSPYHFYAISNAASLFALLSYPILFEPNFTLKTQALMWSVGYIFYILIFIYCAVQLIKLKGEKQEIINSSDIKNEMNITNNENTQSEPDVKPTWKSYFVWISLSICTCTMLLAITNQMCQDMTPVPFLWVLPLSIYLLSFVLCFNDKQKRFRKFYVMVFCLTLILGFINLTCVDKFSGRLSIFINITTSSFILLAACMLCHSELYIRRPKPCHLTSFYLMIAIGGALGGIFVGFIAPLIFSGFWEYPLSLIYCFLVIVYTNKKSFLYRCRYVISVISIIFGLLIVFNLLEIIMDTKEIMRNFYGVIRITQYMDEDIPINELLYGNVVHGEQFTKGPNKNIPTAYFTENSGIGIALTNHPKRLANQPMRIGIIGLGIGTLAAYAKEDDYIRFYEIDPNVIKIANDTTYFTYLSDCPAEKDVILGDARICLEQELASDDNQQFDILVVDAFSSDAIPVHLLTSEVFEIYLEHLNPNGGVIAINISNAYLDFIPVLWKAKEHFGLNGVFIKSFGDIYSYEAYWVLLTYNKEFLEIEAIVNAKSDVKDIPNIRLWTDNYSNLYQLLIK